MPAFQEDSYVVSREIIEKHVYIKLFDSITDEKKTQTTYELKLINSDKDYYFF